jgi:multidrug transporter EmrE-like cation transporter
MSLTSGVLILSSIALSAIAQIAFKLGATSEPAPMIRALLGPFAILTTPGVVAGLALYGIGTLLWVHALSRVDISQAYPFVSLGFVLTALGGWWLFGETISFCRLAGIMTIVAGTLLIAWS